MMVENFLENLRLLLETNGLNQSQFAKEIDLSQSTVNGWYLRRSIPNTETVEMIAGFFRIEPYYFFMKPGTQGEIRPTEREDEFKTFLDGLAEKYLNEDDLLAYRTQGGHNTFVKQMVSNYETNSISYQDWYQHLAKKVAEYAGLDLLEKVRQDLLAKMPQKNHKKPESA